MSYTDEELLTALQQAQDALFDACKQSFPGETAEEWGAVIATHKNRVESLYLLCQMMPLRAKVKPDVSGLVPNEASVPPATGDEDALPECHEETCNYQEPHLHGFACDKSCVVCGGV